MHTPRAPLTTARRAFLVWTAGLLGVGVVLVVELQARIDQRDVPAPIFCGMGPTETPPMTVTPERLVDVYVADRAKALRAYGDKRLRLQGKIASVKQDGLGYLVVRLKAGRAGKELLCFSAPRKALASLKPGAALTIEATLDQSRKNRLAVQVLSQSYTL